MEFIENFAIDYVQRIKYIGLEKRPLGILQKRRIPHLYLQEITTAYSLKLCFPRKRKKSYKAELCLRLCLQIFVNTIVDKLNVLKLSCTRNNFIILGSKHSLYTHVGLHVDRLHAVWHCSVIHSCLKVHKAVVK